MPVIHPTAIVDPDAKIADSAEVGPYCIVESDVEIGEGTVLRNHVVVRRHTSIGRGNLLDSNVVLGGEPQDYGFDPKSVTYLKIGNDNIFREGVTISRATGEGNSTVIGSRGYWMSNSHAGHNVTVDDDVILVNGSGLGGHARLGRRAILSSNVMIHQFTWIGEGVMSQGQAGAAMHVPPFCMFANINCLVGLNVTGLRRADDITNEDRRQIKDAFSILYRARLTPAEALAKMDTRHDWGAAAGRFLDFVRRAISAEKPFNRGLMPLRRRNRQVAS